MLRLFLESGFSMGFIIVCFYLIYNVIFTFFLLSSFGFCFGTSIWFCVFFDCVLGVVLDNLLCAYFLGVYLGFLLRVFSTWFSLFFVFARDVIFLICFWGLCFNYNFHLEMSIHWSCFVDLYLDSFVFRLCCDVF